ncbi:MAG: hypothetical protein OXC39_04805 [Candidatus Dadabacteria bacterium]|nr:hypothetical protein [Candidatus Dadabacteria bacterium]
MKKLDDFSTEEVGEEWLRELYKVVARRRYVMYRMIMESTRMLLFGNGGGAALIIGFMAASSRVGEASAFHWLNVLILTLFGVGVLTSALTTFLVTMVSVKEAHGAEEGLKKFVDGDTNRNQAMFVVDGRTLYFADLATVTATISTLSFILGGLCSIVLLVWFF